MSRLGLLLAGVALAGCFDFRADLARCQQEHRCPLEDGGFFVDAGGLPGGLCAQGACWENPFPTGVPIASLHAAGPDEFYAGGSHGVVVHLKGGQADISYLGRPVPPNIDWRPVTGLARCSTGVSALTGDRQLFTASGADFAPVSLGPQSSPSTTVVQGWSSPGGTCTFLGQGGQAIWVGEEKAGKLATLGSPSTSSAFWRRMRGLGGTSAEDLWLASDRDLFVRAGDGGFELDTAALPDGGLNAVTGVCSLGSGSVFVSAADGIRARSSGWGPLGSARALTGIACLSSGAVVATGAGLVRRCATDGTCTDLEGPETWQAVTAAGEQALVASSRGDLALLTPSGDALARLSSGTRETLLDLALLDGEEAWAAGRAATLLHRTAAGWSQVDAGFAPTDDLYAVAALRDGRVVVAGSGGALRVLNPDGGVDKPKLRRTDGTLVQNQQLGRDLRRVREIGDQVWLLGTGAMLLREDSDGSWRQQAVPETWDIYDAQQNDAGVVWLTGSGAGVLQSEPGGTWRSIRGPFSSYSFFTIFIDSKGAVWFGGRDGLGMRLHPDGGQGTFSFPGNSDEIMGFIEQEGDSLYAVGQQSLYRYAGEPLQWEIVGPLPLDQWVNPIQAVGARGADFWVVGGGGAILRVDRAQWLRSP